ncbi:sugar ABC transporter ATP-binding protein [Nocardioides maradonensis]
MNDLAVATGGAGSFDLAPPALATDGICKTYGATKALDDVSLTVSTGAIHGLMGGNGSGKSTFIKMLAGVVVPEAGRLAIGGDWADARTHTTAKAKAAGLHFVHQQNSTFPDLTVAENLALGRGFERTRAGSIAWRAQRARARAVLQRFEVDVDPDTPMVRLSAAAQMMVAIVRALQDQDDTQERGILVLDEPTASLPKHEVDILLSGLRRYAAAGQTIVYVSHRLEEVIAIADEVTVLRNGRVASRLVGGRINHESLVAGITGSATSATDRADVPDGAAPTTTGAPVVTFGRPGLRAGQVAVRPGEIVAVAGLLGSGRSRLLKQLFGVTARDGLEAQLAGTELPGGSVRHAMARGVAFVPENRLAEAAFPELSIAENLSITCLSEHATVGWIRPSREHGAARRLIGEFGVRAPSESAPLTALSGGNQQKVILARWLQRRPELLLLDEPTQGVDVGARTEIHQLVRAAAAAGTAVLVVSSDFAELAALCHRAVVVSKGSVVNQIAGPLDEDALNDVVYAQEKSA